MGTTENYTLKSPAASNTQSSGHYTIFGDGQKMARQKAAPP